ncbi:MAG: TetR/AcrR family transcriptional regulator, partial [Bacteroidota bacterium]
MPKSELFDRTEVLQRAMSIFRRSGYHGTSMQELVDAMGINRSSIYNSFGDKQNLFKETLRLYREEQKSQTHNWLLEAAHAKEAIQLLFRGVEDEIVTDKQNMGCFMTKSTSEFGSSNVDFFEILTKNQREMETIFADLISKGQETGDINPEL